MAAYLILQCFPKLRTYLLNSPSLRQWAAGTIEIMTCEWEAPLNKRHHYLRGTIKMRTCEWEEPPNNNRKPITLQAQAQPINILHEYIVSSAKQIKPHLSLCSSKYSYLYMWPSAYCCGCPSHALYSPPAQAPNDSEMFHGHIIGYKDGQRSQAPDE